MALDSFPASRVGIYPTHTSLTFYGTPKVPLWQVADILVLLFSSSVFVFPEERFTLDLWGLGRWILIYGRWDYHQNCRHITLHNVSQGMPEYFFLVLLEIRCEVIFPSQFHNDGVDIWPTSTVVVPWFCFPITCIVLVYWRI
jgi:hypothetical protein